MEALEICYIWVAMMVLVASIASAITTWRKRFFLLTIVLLGQRCTLELVVSDDILMCEVTLGASRWKTVGWEGTFWGARGCLWVGGPLPRMGKHCGELSSNVEGKKRCIRWIGSSFSLSLAPSTSSLSSLPVGLKFEFEGDKRSLMCGGQIIGRLAFHSWIASKNSWEYCQGRFFDLHWATVRS